MKRSVAYNTLVQYAGKGIGLVISFFTTTLLLRSLGVAGYGEYAIIYAVAGIFTTLPDLGFFWFTVKELTGLDTDQQERRLRQLFASRLATLLLAVVAFILLVVILSRLHAYSARVIVLLYWSAIFVFGSVFNNFLAGLFQFNMRMDYPIFGDLLGRLAVLGVVVYSYFHARSFFVLASSPIVGIVITILVSAYFMRRNFFLPLRLEWRGAIKNALKLIPYGIVTVLTFLYFKADTFILSLLKPAVDVGIYSAPYRMIELALLLPSMFVSSLYPTLTQAANDSERLNQLTSLSFQLLIFIGLPVLVLIELFSHFIVGLVGGQEFLTVSTISFMGHAVTSVGILQVLMFFVFISFLTNLVGPLLFSLNKNRVLARLYLGILVANVLLNLALIPHFSYLGSAAINIVTESLVLIFGLRLAAGRIHLRLDWNLIGRWLAIGLSTIVFTLVLKAVTLLPDALLLLMAAVWYGTLILVTKSYNRGWKIFLRSHQASPTTPEV